MIVLFRLDRIAGVVPVVDAHTAGSILRVEVALNGQTQSTDDFGVPSRSQRVEVEARTQLLWTAPPAAAGSAEGALDVALYQDWPEAREAHPTRVCLGRCSLALPAEQLRLSGHACAEVCVPLGLGSHPLPSARQWPAPTLSGLLECSSLQPHPQPQPQPAHQPHSAKGPVRAEGSAVRAARPTPRRPAPATPRAAAAKDKAAAAACASATPAPAARRAASERRPSQPAAAAIPEPSGRSDFARAASASRATAAAAECARLVCSPALHSGALAAAKAAAARDLARIALGESTIPDSCGMARALMPPELVAPPGAHARPGAVNRLGCAGADGALRARSPVERALPLASAFAFGGSAPVPLAAQGSAPPLAAEPGTAGGRAASGAVERRACEQAPAAGPSRLARSRRLDMSEPAAARGADALCAFAFGAQSAISSPRDTHPPAACARVAGGASLRCGSLTELSDALLTDISREMRAAPPRAAALDALGAGRVRSPLRPVPVGNCRAAATAHPLGCAPRAAARHDPSTPSDERRGQQAASAAAATAELRAQPSPRAAAARRQQPPSSAAGAAGGGSPRARPQGMSRRLDALEARISQALQSCDVARLAAPRRARA